MNLSATFPYEGVAMIKGSHLDPSAPMIPIAVKHAFEDLTKKFTC